MSVNVEIKSGTLYNITDIPYGDGKKYLSFIVGTIRDYKEKGKRSLNYRNCRVYNQLTIDYMKDKISGVKPGAKIMFYLEGESYCYKDKSKDENGKTVYIDFFKVNKAQFVGFVASDYEQDVPVEIEW